VIVCSILCIIESPRHHRGTSSAVKASVLACSGVGRAVHIICWRQFELSDFRRTDLRLPRYPYLYCLSTLDPEHKQPASDRDRSVLQQRWCIKQSRIDFNFSRKMMQDPMANLTGEAPAGQNQSNMNGGNTKEVFDPIALQLNMQRIGRIQSVMGIAAGCVAGIAGMTGFEGLSEYIARVCL
jgi:hypothetical protein